MSQDHAPGRIRVRVRGAVQGVGFRPFVHRLAARYELSGFVLNDTDGVLAEVEGVALDAFLVALQREPPSLARIDGVEVTPVPGEGVPGFRISESIAAVTGRITMVADAATCEACLEEMFDPGSRFHLYPFITCTQCGPRFSISERLPYDRANTSMAKFGICPNCTTDYRDTRSRRFHAETIACAACGLRLSHPVADIAAALRNGGIVALKGLGGFHLLCDATNTASVEALRRRKVRPEKPLRSWSQIWQRLRLSACRRPKNGTCSAGSPARSCWSIALRGFRMRSRRGWTGSA